MAIKARSKRVGMGTVALRRKQAKAAIASAAPDASLMQILVAGRAYGQRRSTMDVAGTNTYVVLPSVIS
jgi:hypothetical protein